MTGILSKAYEDMEKGVTNFCKDGKCIGCGQCCSNILPLSASEIKDIKRYIAKKHIKATVRNVMNTDAIDLLCPFLDDTKSCDKCKIYPVRPKICREFKCDIPPSKVHTNEIQFWKDHEPCLVREVFFGED